MTVAMNTITPIVMLFYVAGIDSRKHIARVHTERPEPEASHELTDRSDTEVADDVYELLGLVILDYDTLTRRNMEHPIVVSTTEDDAPTKAQKHRKSRKSAHHTTTIKPKTTKGTSTHKTTKTSKTSRVTKTTTTTTTTTESSDINQASKEIIENEKPPLREGKSSELETEPTPHSKVLRSSCVSETEKQMQKCMRACNRAHEDVCDRMKCSSRSIRALKKECKNNCKKVFEPDDCYRRQVEIE